MHPEYEILTTDEYGAREAAARWLNELKQLNS
jgi:hypothetical protein